MNTLKCLAASAILLLSAVPTSAIELTLAGPEPFSLMDTVSAPALSLQSTPDNNDKSWEHHGIDVNIFRSRTNPATHPYTFWDDQTWVGIPVFLAGVIAKGEKKAFRQDYNNPNTSIRLVKYDFHSEIDNYTQFFGPVLATGLKIGGVEGRSDWPRFLASAGMSYAVMAAFVNGIKYTASEMRPDGSTRNSWPSGHTATAFVGATFLHKEYGLTRSPWYSVAGYTVATATGVMRVLNNRHWISDVLSGAGIGIFSGELAYGLCDLMFKGRGLLRNDLATYPDLAKSPSFFAVEMGIGLGNKNLSMPAFDYSSLAPLIDDTDITDDEPLDLKFRSATAVAAEAAWFFSRYVGIGGRLRVKSTPINGWSQFALKDEKALRQFTTDPDMLNSVKNVNLTIESDHLTEFAADAGIYFSFPISRRFAIGTKALFGRSVMNAIDVDANMQGNQLELDLDSPDMFRPTTTKIDYSWDYINVKASNGFKFGSGVSLTYAHKNNFCWRAFVDYDYSRKTFTATYNPLAFYNELCPQFNQLIDLMFGVNLANQSFTSSATKKLHQWVIGGAFTVAF